jgi:hypothetical protein
LPLYKDEQILIWKTDLSTHIHYRNQYTALKSSNAKEGSKNGDSCGDLYKKLKILPFHS